MSIDMCLGNILIDIYFLTQIEHLILDWMDLVLMGKKCHKGYYVN